MLGVSLGALLLSCEAEEAKTVSVPMVASGHAMFDVENDRGNTIRFTQAQIVVDTFTFSSGLASESDDDGTVASALTHLSSWLIPQARAHPGHAEGGAVLGELAGHHVLTFTPASEQPVGDATFLLGDITGLNWVFGTADVDDVDREDALLGHTAVLSGEAQRGGDVCNFRSSSTPPKTANLRTFLATSPSTSRSPKRCRSKFSLKTPSITTRFLTA